MSILVTGATGFIGSSLVEALLDKGFRVVGVGRRSKGLLTEQVLRNKNFKLLQMDLASCLNEGLKRENISQIIHSAALLPGPGISLDEYYNANVSSTQRLLDWCSNRNIAQVIFISTLSVFGEKPEENTLIEKICPKPISHYGISKFMAEMLIRMELRESGIQASIVRFPSIVGKNASDGIVCHFYECAKHNKDIEVFSKGERHRSLLHISGVVKIILQLLEKKESLGDYEMFFGGSCDSMSVFDIATFIRDYLGSRSKIKLVPSFPPTDWDVFVNTSKIENVLGSKPPRIKEELEKYLSEMISEKS